jgi:hypothetical protein
MKGHRLLGPERMAGDAALTGWRLRYREVPATAASRWRAGYEEARPRRVFAAMGAWSTLKCGLMLRHRRRSRTAAGRCPAAASIMPRWYKNSALFQPVTNARFS